MKGVFINDLIISELNIKEKRQSPLLIAERQGSREGLMEGLGK